MKNTLKLTLAVVLGATAVAAFAAEGTAKPAESTKVDGKKVAQEQRDAAVKAAVADINAEYATATKDEKDAAKLKEAAAARDAKLANWKKGGEAYKAATEAAAQANNVEAKDVADTCTYCEKAKELCWSTKYRKAATVVAAAAVAGVAYYAYNSYNSQQDAE